MFTGITNLITNNNDSIIQMCSMSVTLFIFMCVIYISGYMSNDPLTLFHVFHKLTSSVGSVHLKLSCPLYGHCSPHPSGMYILS